MVETLGRPSVGNKGKCQEVRAANKGEGWGERNGVGEGWGVSLAVLYKQS